MPTTRSNTSRRSSGLTRRAFAIAVAGILFGLAPSIARAQCGAGADSVALTWTAPGDDGIVGRAASYELRVSTAVINDANWSAACVVPGVPIPGMSGFRENYLVRNLSRGVTYYFAIRSTDDQGNQSPLSNVVRWDWVYDTSAPSAPIGLTASREGDNVRVRWTPNGEPDLGGYDVYRSLASGGPFTALTQAPISGTEYLDSSIPQGTETVWYRISATDLSGNESAQSATVMVPLVTQSTTWNLSPGYPNPSRFGQPVNIPLFIPTSGAGSVALEIFDAGGHRVRRLDLSGYGAGPQSVVWDGKNQSGRDLAPGVYTAWLIGGDTRKNIKLVRVP